jgi:hypothetical protein
VAPSLQQQALHLVSNALEVTIVLLELPHGLVSIAVEATTALTALVLQRPAPTKCLRLADGELCKSKAPLSSWKQPTASTTASGTSRQATACSANASRHLVARRLCIQVSGASLALPPAPLPCLTHPPTLTFAGRTSQCSTRPAQCPNSPSEPGVRGKRAGR